MSVSKVSKKPLTQTVEPPVALPVTVEAVIGHIDMGLGTGSPFQSGMHIIARYHESMLDNGGVGDNVYRFPGPDEGETIVVTIASEFSKRAGEDVSDKDILP